MADDGLIEWANKQQDWVRDALRRHTAFPGFILSAEESAAILARVRTVGGFPADPTPECSPLLYEHLLAKKSAGARTILCSLGPVKNLNRLATEQQLRFAIDGLTVIYGDNGSGKSGYCRIAKKLCRSLTADDLLGNVFEADIQPPAEVLVRYQTDGAKLPTEVAWMDGKVPPIEIAQLTVFDSHNARLYVDKQNRIGFLPAELALLEQHGAHCKVLDALFSSEVTAIDKRLRTPLPGAYSGRGPIPEILSHLDSKSKNPLPTELDIKVLATFAAAEQSELAALEIELSNDPSTMAGRLRRVKAILKAYHSAAKTIEARLSSEAATSCRALWERADITAQAAKLTASDRFAEYPLAGVGLSPWRLMYDHASAFAASLSGGKHKHLPENQDDCCVLCLQPLSAEGAMRIKEFNEFVAGATSKAADDSAIEYHEALRLLREVAIPTEAAAEIALGEYGDLSAARKGNIPAIAKYFDAAEQRRKALVGATDTETFAAIPVLSDEIVTNLTAEIEALETEALAHDKAAADDDARNAARLRRDHLKNQKKLSEDLPTVLTRLRDLVERRKLTVCRSAVDTGAVSRQITALRRSLVMEKLESRILAEISELALTHIPFTVSDKSQDGQSYFEVGLSLPAAIANSKVLSEGEQRALALACFLAEIGGDTDLQGLIIDDPVSSLDHVRIRLVAARLVREAAKGRQVIIFTHNLFFFNEVLDASAQVTPPVPVTKNYFNKSEAAGFGLISETDEPWIAQPVSTRIETLRKRLATFDAIKDFTTDDWRRKGKDFYTDLRETWERLVEELLLGNVVERMKVEVKTLRLKEVVFEDADYQIVYWAMKRASERSGHDMAVGRNVPMPLPAEMRSDLTSIDDYRLSLKDRKKSAGARRKALEDPPAASVV